MRRVLVDDARRRQAQKYGADAVQVSLANAEGIAHGKSADLAPLDDALNELATFDERQSKIVELRFLGGAEPGRDRRGVEDFGAHGAARMESGAGVALP